MNTINISLFGLFFILTGCERKSPETFLMAVKEQRPLTKIEKLYDLKFIPHKDTLGNTPLHWACYNNDIATISWLMKKGADAFEENNKGETAYSFATLGNHQESVRIIGMAYLEKWKKLPDRFSEEQLVFAIENDLTFVLNEFLSNGTEVGYEIPSTGIPLLILAIFSDSKEVIKFLLSKKADPNTRFDTRPAIGISAMFGQYEICEILLKSGADPNLADGTRSTALMMAVKEKHFDIEALLLKFGADKTLTDIEGLSAYDRVNK